MKNNLDFQIPTSFPLIIILSCNLPCAIVSSIILLVVFVHGFCITSRMYHYPYHFLDAMRSILVCIDNRHRMECILDPGCQVITMYSMHCHELSLA